ncbi:MAG: hypothetical protein UHD09_06135, partial [Bifidobacterium sp.]|nr:hypothetical protein [Bifidobacterium sp.]
LLHRLAAVASDPLDEPNASVMTDAFATVVRVIEADEELFRLLVVDVPDERFVARWKDGIAAYLWRRLFDTDARDGALRLPVRDGAPTVNRELMVEMFTGMMLAFVRFRLEHPERVRMEEVMALMPELTAAISRVW